ncbi:MAG: hypothetical protein NUV76_02495 [Candidatus Kuenenia sp.]|nr:hypothetical protein [Candidatus Kuenenia sp.]
MSEYETEPLTKYPAELYSTIRLKDKYKKGDVLTFWDTPWLYMPYPQYFEIMQIIISYTDNGEDQSFFAACQRLKAHTQATLDIHEYPIGKKVRLIFDNPGLTKNDAGMYTLDIHFFRSIKLETQDYAYVLMEFTKDVVFPKDAQISMSLIGDVNARSEPKLKVVNNTLYPV